MAIIFPSNPTPDQPFTSGSTTWKWSGTTWAIVPNSSPTFTSLSATTITGALTGNVTGNTTGTHTGSVIGNVTGTASTATALSSSRTINGVSFNGTEDITITSASNTLSGTTLNSTVITSSLTTVGTLDNLEVDGAITVNNAITATGNITTGGNVVISQVPTASTHATNKQYVDTKSIAMSIALS
jgi:hypothetical protein